MTESLPGSSTIIYVTGTSTGTAAPTDQLSFLTKLQLAKQSAVPQEPRIAGTGTTVHTPTASWLGDVQRRLNASIGVSGGSDLLSGAALASGVVSTANNFFGAVSSLLPSEPYLYGLPHGRLVAEFKTPHGGLTLVISETSALAMSTLNGEAIHQSIPLFARPASEIQKDLAKFTSHLGIDEHGALESR